MVKCLEIVEFGGKKWFADCRLEEFRNIYNPHERVPFNGIDFRVVCYQRIEPDEPEALTWKEALKEKRHWKLLYPEDIFKIEEVEE